MPKALYHLDTSVVMRLLTREPLNQFKSALQFINKITKENSAGFISDVVVAEAYFALQNHYGLAKSQALEALKLMISDKRFLVNSYVLDLIKSETLTSGTPGFVDKLIYSEAVSRGAVWVSFEKSAKNLKHAQMLPNVK